MPDSWDPERYKLASVIPARPLLILSAFAPSPTRLGRHLGGKNTPSGTKNHGDCVGIVLVEGAGIRGGSRAPDRIRLEGSRTPIGRSCWSRVLHRSRWRGSDLRISIVLALVVVTLCGLPAVWNSQWTWIDDQIVVGGQLWPPQSMVNQSYHTMGREVHCTRLVPKALIICLPAAAVLVLFYQLSVTRLRHWPSHMGRLASYKIRGRHRSLYADCRLRFDRTGGLPNPIQA